MGGIFGGELLCREELFRGNCLGVVVFMGIIQGFIVQRGAKVRRVIAWRKFLRGQLSRGKLFRGNCQGSKSLGGNCPEGIFTEGICPGSSCPGGN